ncbi:MAG: NAD(+) diphosphatase [Porticoccaceae bacterium]
MTFNDELHIRDPYAFERIEGKIVITCGDDIVYAGANELFWEYGQLKWVMPEDAELHYLGEYGGHSIFTVELLPSGFEILSPRISGLRKFLGNLPDGLFRLLGRALQINDWYRAHRYCGYCGGRTTIVANERAMGCDRCRKIYYPRLSPCIMALITRGNECLLARNGQWTVPYYSVLAGFIEPGESAEAALRREVMEEVGLNVGNLHYMGSQPWPFPGQLMLGFFADYAGGDIRVDGIEIVDAQWYPFNDLPNIPGEFSLSGQLIRLFVERCRQQAE